MKPSRSIDKYLACSFVLALLFGLVGASCNLGSEDDPSQVIITLLKLVQASKTDQAFMLMEQKVHGDAETSNKMKSNMSSWAEVMRSMGGIKKVDVIEEQISLDGSTAFVHLKISFGKGEIREDPYYLIREEEKWRIKAR